MVSSNSNTADTTNNDFQKSSPDALHLWRKFKKVKKEEAYPSLNDKDKENKKTVNDKKQSKASDYSSFGSSPDGLTSKKSITQEQIFRLHCQSHYRNTAQDSSSSTDFSASDSDSKHRYLTSGDDHSVNLTGVLHLRKPLSTNLDNNKIYYEDRGRMPPIDWKNAIGSKVGLEEKPREKNQKAETQKETITTIAKSKPQISVEFSNFVENSVSHKSAYNKQGNIERNINAIDSPIFKIQQRISKDTLDTIQIPVSVKSSFFNKVSDSHLLNRISTFRAIDPMTYKSSQIINKRRNEGNNRCKLNENNNRVQSRMAQVESKKQDHPPIHVYDDYDHISYVDTLTEEQNVAKRESRKKEMSYEDDFFTFVENPPKLSQVSQINSNLPATSPKKKNPYSFPFDRIKAVCKEREKTNKTWDSDDTCDMCSDLSNRTVSLRASSQILKKKMDKITWSSNVHANASILPDDSRVLENKNKLLNRCVRASHDYSTVPENNVVEITEVKVGLKPELLIKPIATRYFAKVPHTNEEKLNNNKHVVIKNISSSVLTENTFRQQDKQIDSGFCIKSNDNSSSICDSTESSRLESKTDNEKTLEDLTKQSGIDCQKIEAMSLDSENEEMDSGHGYCQDFIDYDAFDVENVEMFFPTLKNLKEQVSSGPTSMENQDLNNDASLSNNANDSTSFNLNSNSDNSSSSNSQCNFNSNIFENVNIEFSSLRTDGLDDDYGENRRKEIEFCNVQQLAPDSEISNSSNFINNNVTYPRNQEECKSSHENAPKPISKKIQKYRITLENFKNKKFSYQADTIQEDKMDEKPLKRPILQEINKHMQLIFKPNL